VGVGEPVVVTVGVLVRVGGNHCVGVDGRPVGLGPGVLLALGTGVVGAGVSPGASVAVAVGCGVGVKVKVGTSSASPSGTTINATTPRQ
jgi:hypothetical protein